jgi:ABC-2 type transport system permease protein
VRVYLALFSTQFQQHLQYRVAAVAGALTNIAFGFFRIFLLTAFYASSSATQPMSLPAVYSYIWFGQVLFGVLPLTGMLWGDAEEIRTGAIAYRLTRPVSLYSLTYARALGQRTTALCSRSLIQVVVLLVLLPLLGLSRYGMGAPAPDLLPLLGISLVLTVFLSAAIQTFVIITGFWTISTRGSLAMSYAVIALFSGLLVPLKFFPPVLRRVADILPFRGIYDTPALLYTGSMDVSQAGPALVHQALWLALIVGAGALLARLGTRRLEIAGG